MNTKKKTLGHMHIFWMLRFYRRNEQSTIKFYKTAWTTVNRVENMCGTSWSWSFLYFPCDKIQLSWDLLMLSYGAGMKEGEIK